MFFFVTKWPHVYHTITVEQPPLHGNYNMVYMKHAKILVSLAIHPYGRGPTEDLQVQGWGKALSPFWELQWMHNHLYNCFRMCYLHCHSLGLAKVWPSPPSSLTLFLCFHNVVLMVVQMHLLYTTLKFGKVMWEPLQQCLLHHDPFMGLKKLPAKGIFKQPTTKVCT
jgi:hypothetical protein